MLVCSLTPVGVLCKLVPVWILEPVWVLKPIWILVPVWILVPFWIPVPVCSLALALYTLVVVGVVVRVLCSLAVAVPACIPARCASRHGVHPGTGCACWWPVR